MNNQRDDKRNASSSYGIDSQGSSEQRNQAGQGQQMGGERGFDNQQRDRSVGQSQQTQQGREEAGRKRTDEDTDTSDRL